MRVVVNDKDKTISVVAENRSDAGLLSLMMNPWYTPIRVYGKDRTKEAREVYAQVTKGQALLAEEWKS